MSRICILSLASSEEPKRVAIDWNGQAFIETLQNPRLTRALMPTNCCSLGQQEYPTVRQIEASKPGKT